MKIITLVAASSLLLTACVTTQGKPGYNLQTPNSDQPVIEENGVASFTLVPGECSRKSYSVQRLGGGSTSDCGRQRTRVEYSERARAYAGDQKLYSWEIFIPKDFSYNALGGHLIAGQFHSSKDLLFSFALDNDGYTARSKTCIAPEDFGRWVKVSVKYRFDSTRRKSLQDETPGVLVVTCDGKEIIDASGRPNLPKGSSVYFKYGLYGALDFEETDNVTVKYRNVSITHWE